MILCVSENFSFAQNIAWEGKIAAPCDIASFDISGFSCALVDLSCAASCSFVDRLSLPLFAFASSSDDETLFRAYSLGIAPVVTPDFTRTYSSSALAAPAVTGEKIILVDEDSRRSSLLKSLCALYGAELVHLKSQEELYCADHDGISMLFANITSGAFNVQEYVKRSHSSRLKFIPFVPFRTKDDWVNISDILSGLNRVARVIMDCSEAVSFLAYLLSSSDLSRSHGVVSSAKMCAAFGSRGIRSYYHEKGKDAFKVRSCMTSGDDADFVSAIDELKNSAARREMIKWLIREDDSRITCAQGV